MTVITPPPSDALHSLGVGKVLAWRRPNVATGRRPIDLGAQSHSITMTPQPQPPAAPAEPIAPLILSLRDQRVLLDADLARLYGVETRALNQAVRRNLGRFPADFFFKLTPAEKNEVITNCDHLRNLRFAKALPLAFTEHGALMAAMVLSSPRAVAMSVYVIRAFVQMREAQAANAAILKRLAEIDKTLLTHDVALRDIYHKLLPLLRPPPDPPRKEIGFHIKEDAVPYRVRRRRPR